MLQAQLLSLNLGLQLPCKGLDSQTCSQICSETQKAERDEAYFTRNQVCQASTMRQISKTLL